MKKTYQKPFLEKVFVTPLNVMAASQPNPNESLTQPVGKGGGANIEVLSKEHDFNAWDE